MASTITGGIWRTLLCAYDSSIAVDLNRDGRAEVLVGYVDAPGMAYFNDGRGKRFEAVPFGDGQGAIYGMAAGNLDGDGWPDIVVARSDAPGFMMFNRPPKKQALRQLSEGLIGSPSS